MTFTQAALPGVWLVDCEAFEDERGVFTIAWKPEEFEAHGLETTIAQCSLVSNRKRGTIRGLHYQVSPFEESKLIRAVRGRVFDVAVDLRPESPTFRQWTGVTLTAENRRMLYLPVGVAHGYQTLTDDAEVFYFVSAAYSPDHQRGLRWDDPAVGIEWPLGPPTGINDRDASYPDLA